MHVFFAEISLFCPTLAGVLKHVDVPANATAGFTSTAASQTQNRNAVLGDISFICCSHELKVVKSPSSPGLLALNISDARSALRAQRASARGAQAAGAAQEAAACHPSQGPGMVSGASVAPGPARRAAAGGTQYMIRVLVRRRLPETMQLEGQHPVSSERQGTRTRTP